MQIILSISRLCLCSYLCFAGLQLGFAHDLKEQAIDNVKEAMIRRMGSEMGPTEGQNQKYGTAHGNGPFMAQTAQEDHKQSMNMTKSPTMDKQAMSNTSPPIIGGTAKQRIPKDARKQATDQSWSPQNTGLGRQINQTSANTKVLIESHGKIQSTANGKLQTLGISKNQNLTNSQNRTQTSCQPQTQSQADGPGIAESDSTVMGQGKGQSIVHGQVKGNTAQVNGHNSGQAGRHGQVIDLSKPGAQSLGQIAGKAEAIAQSIAVGNGNQVQTAASSLPEISSGGNQQVSTNQNRIQKGNAQNRNAQDGYAQNSAASPAVASNAAIFSGVASAKTSGSVAEVVTSIEAASVAIKSSSNAGTCNCQCNCPAAAFAMAQQVAMMSVMAAPPPQSTLQTSTAAQANGPGTTGSLSLRSSPPASTPTTSPPPAMTVAQAQAAKAPTVASPQSEGGVTPGAIAAALPTNLNTFSFQSAVTVPLGKRRVARTIAFW